MMERKKAGDFPPEVMQLFDGYVHGRLERREFLDRAAKFAVGAFTASAMLESLKPNFAWAQQVPKDDARIRTQYLEYESPQGHGRMRGYFAMPANAKGRLPAVLVIHENRGLNPYIEDVARRLATADFVAFAPDALTPVGGYPGDEDAARKLFAAQDAAKRLEDLHQAAQVLKARPEAGKVGAVGFCFGGYVCNHLATRMPNLAAAVPYYGRQVPAAEVAKIRAPLLLYFAGNDENVNKTWPAYEAALKAHQVRHAAHIYPDTLHGFHNDTTPRYDEAAAKLSWQRTLEFFNQQLRV
jgi:carboxymethylenebutenolidase